VVDDLPRKSSNLTAIIRHIIEAEGYNIICPQRLERIFEMIDGLPAKLQDDISARAVDLRIAGRLPIEIIEEILDMISGAIELMELDASDSDRHRPLALTREQLKIAIELADRRMNYDEHMRHMEELIEISSGSSTRPRPPKDIIN